MKTCVWKVAVLSGLAMAGCGGGGAAGDPAAARSADPADCASELAAAPVDPRAWVDILDLYTKDPELAYAADIIAWRAYQYELTTDPDLEALSNEELTAVVDAGHAVYGDKVPIADADIARIRATMKLRPIPPIVDSEQPIMPTLLDPARMVRVGSSLEEVGSAYIEEMSGAVLGTGPHKVVVYAFTRWADPMAMEIRVADLANPAERTVFAGAGKAYQWGPRRVRLGNAEYLYFAGADSMDGPVSYHRSRFQGGVFGAAEELAIQPDLFDMWSNPQFVALPEGTVAFAYLDSTRGRFQLAFSRDGVTFGKPRLAVPGAAMPSVARFRGGPLVVSFQEGENGGRMQPYLRLSRDGGATWTRPAYVDHDLSINIHDCALNQRQDGGVDLYYIASFHTAPADPPDSLTGFEVFRRRLHPDGSMGPRQRLTDMTFHDLMKPTLTRTLDGETYLSAAQGVRVPGEGLVGTSQVIMLLPPWLTDSRP